MVWEGQNIFPCDNRNMFKTFYSLLFKIQSLTTVRATFRGETGQLWVRRSELAPNVIFVCAVEKWAFPRNQAEGVVSILTRNVNPFPLLTTVLDVSSQLIKNIESVVRLNSCQLVLLHRKVFCTERSCLCFLSKSDTLRFWQKQNLLPEQKYLFILPLMITDFFSYLKKVFSFQVWQDFGNYLEELVIWLSLFFFPPHPSF